MEKSLQELDVQQKAWLVNFGSSKIQCIAEDVVTYLDNIGKYVIKNY